VLGEFGRSQGLQELAGRFDEAEPDLVGGDLAVEQPGSGFLVGHGLREEVVQLHDLDAPFAHIRHELGVVALGVLDPHDVVEQQAVRVGRREPPVRQARRAHEDLAKPSDL
jgi:hypothetical protein